MNRCIASELRRGETSNLTIQRFNGSTRNAFTLIEIMVVVGIIGLIAAMGIPSIITAVRKEGMRKAVSDIQEVCANARARAIFEHKPMAVVIHPTEKTFNIEEVPADAAIGAPVAEGNSEAPAAGGKTPSFGETSSSLPDGIDFAMLDVNYQDFSQSEWVRIRFFPNGTADEMTLILHSSDAWRKITLEFATGLTDVSDVAK